MLPDIDEGSLVIGCTLIYLATRQTTYSYNVIRVSMWKVLAYTTTETRNTRRDKYPIFEYRDSEEIFWEMIQLGQFLLPSIFHVYVCCFFCKTNNVEPSKQNTKCEYIVFSFLI